MKHRKKGFTIVELLVVITIIGLLAAIAAVLLTNARKQARDNRRIEDLKQISTALELYFKENKAYPLSYVGENSWSGHCKSRGALPNDWGGTEDYIRDLEAQEYISDLPVDPRFDTDDTDGTGPIIQQCYAYQSKRDAEGQWRYKLMAFNVMESICGGDPSNSCNPQYIQALDEPTVTGPTISISSVAKDQF